MSRRYDYYNYYEPTRPIETDEGLKARSRQGKIGQTWWAQRWIGALEYLMDAGRLRRGRSYARAGQVLSIEEREGGITARVQGSRPRPYTVRIRLRPLTDAQWEAVIDEMAGQAIFAAQLLAGEMPPDIEKAFAAAGVNLFPVSTLELVTECSCPDPENPCKHIAAAHYILGEQFDEDPFLIFRLLGRTQEQILAALHERRAVASGIAETEAAYELDEAPEQVAPLSATLASFWQPAIALESLAPAVRGPAVALPLLKRLGPPAFLPDQDLAQLMAPAYEAITQAALGMAYGDENGGTQP